MILNQTKTRIDEAIKMAKAGGTDEEIKTALGLPASAYAAMRPSIESARAQASILLKQAIAKRAAAGDRAAAKLLLETNAQKEQPDYCPDMDAYPETGFPDNHPISRQNRKFLEDEQANALALIVNIAIRLEENGETMGQKTWEKCWQDAGYHDPTRIPRSLPK
jgi:hypothetical protein